MPTNVKMSRLLRICQSNGKFAVLTQNVYRMEKLSCAPGLQFTQCTFIQTHKTNIRTCIAVTTHICAPGQDVSIASNVCPPDAPNMWSKTAEPAGSIVAMPPYPRESTKGMERVRSVWHKAFCNQNIQQSGQTQQGCNTDSNCDHNISKLYMPNLTSAGC